MTFINRMKSSFKVSYLINIIFIALIFTACLWDVGSLERIRVVDDGFCYWGIAATLSGYDWIDLISGCAYYSYGYSIVLIPLFWLYRLGISMTVLYRISIVLNAFFLIGIYFMTLYMLKELFKEFPDVLKHIIGFFVTLYIGNVAQMGLAWSETFLCFMFWCVIVCLYRVLRKPGYGNLLGLAASSAALFAIHMRSIGVLIAVILIILCFFITHRKEINKKYIIYTIGISAFFCCMVLVMKGYVSNNIYLGNAESSTNNVQAGISRVGRLFSINGLMDFAVSVIGKLYYISSATFMLAVIGALAALISIICSLRKKESMARREKWQKKEWMTVFFLLSLLAEVGIEALFQCYSFFRVAGAVGRDDALAFGRYADFVIGPMLILGVWTVYNLREHYKEILFCVLITIAATGIVQFFYNIIEFRKGHDSVSFRFAASPWLSVIATGHNTDFACYVTLISISVLLLLCLTRLFSKIKWYGFGVILLVMTAVWSVLGVKGGMEYTAAKTDKAKLVDTVAEIIETTGAETPVYMIGQPNTEVKILQWLLAKRSIHTCDLEHIDDIDMAHAVLLGNSNEAETVAKLSDRLELLYDAGSISVFANKENKLYEKLSAKAKEMTFVSDDTVNKLSLSDLVTDLSYTNMMGQMFYNYQSSDGGYMMKETGVISGDGIYEFVIDMRATECEPNTEIGYITVGDVNGNIQYTQSLSANDFITRPRQDISVLVEVKDWIEPVVGLYTNGKAAINVFDISYRKKTGNIQLDSEEIAEIAAFLGEQDQKEVYYIDSDNSGLTGFPWWEYGDLKYLSGNIIAYKENFEDAQYIVEKTDTSVINALKAIMEPLYETEGYIVLATH